MHSLNKGINKHYLLLHIIVFIWGFSPVLGRFINTDAYQLVWFRVLITVAVMFLYLKITKHDLKISSKLTIFKIFVLIGKKLLCKQFSLIFLVHETFFRKKFVFQLFD